jgi:hypothetical protein
VLVVWQDFHAKVFMHNLAAMLVWVGQVSVTTLIDVPLTALFDGPPCKLELTT